MDELSATIANVWRQNLEPNEVSLSDNFVELDGHSMLALIVIDDINEKLCTKLSPHLVFEEPLLSEFIELVRREIADSH
jgi:hypothetical protein